MFWRKDTETPIKALADAITDLRSELAGPSSLILGLAERVSVLEQERALRETEMSDLRTRYETLIKRVGARLDSQREPEHDSTYTMQKRLGRR